MSEAAIFLTLMLVMLGFETSRSLPRTMKIGGLFEYEYRGQELAFKYAIEKINARRDILPYTKLTYDIEQLPAEDSFTAAKKVCRQMREGVAAIFGPMSSLSAAHVQSICDALEVPHVETRWDFRENRDFYSINLYPYYRTLSKAYIDLIMHWGWTSFTILYDSNEGLIRLQELLKAPAREKFHITVRRLEAPDGDYRPILKEIKIRGESRVILECHYRHIHEILTQAMSINMMTQYYHYLITNLDVGLVDLDEFKYGGTNVTAVQLVDQDSLQARDVLNDWYQQELLDGMSPLDGEKGILTETALMFDAVYLFARALDELSRAQHIQTSSLSCNKALPWDHGSSLLNYMKMTEIYGLTGVVKYDSQGQRSSFTLDIIQLAKEGIQKMSNEITEEIGTWLKVGTWHSDYGINITQNYNEQREEVADSLKNKTLVVTTILEDPYMMLKDDPTLTGNDRFEGYCVDLLREISKILHFNYTIKLVSDSKYGSPEGPKNEWTGMVRELMDRKADLAVASLTISYLREQVIDFTKPFMNLGISILFKRPAKTNPSLFSFLSPLSFEIWIYMLAAYLVVSFVLFVLARFSPYEWYNPHPCNPDSDVVENQFTLLNSLWFTIGSLMQQGSEVAPRAISTRLVSGIWWFFTLIMISSYTANLAAFLTVERMTSPIENADDLSKQTEIKYGTIFGGSTMTFFKLSKIPTYERMWNFMSSGKPSMFVNSTKEGVERVKKGKYAYLLESTMNEHISQRDCDLMQVGGLLDSKGYGIGTPRGSPYRDLISDAILKLQEDQILQMLYNTWWKQKGGGQCDVDDKGKKDANALAIANVGGVFVVLVAGLVLSLIVAVIEFIYKAHRTADVDRQPLCVEMVEELRFALKCFGSDTKPVKKNTRHTHPDHYVDGNGMTLMPLTGLVPNHGSGQVYSASGKETLA